MKYSRWILLALFSGVVVCCTPKTSLSPATAPPLNQDELIHLADKLIETAQFKSSNYYLRKALEKFREEGNWTKIIECHMKLGSNQQNLGHTREAMDHYDQALQLALKRTGVEYSIVADRFQKMAFRHFKNRNYGQALQLYDKALSLLLKVFPENHIRIAKIYNSIALVYWNLDNRVKATRFYNKSLSIKLRGFNQSRVDYAKKYAFIDGGETQRSAFREIRDYIRKSLKIYLETHGTIDPLIALLYENMGILYSLEGSFERAMEYFRKSLAIRLDMLGDESLESAESYHNIGICLRLQGDTLEALRFLESALQIKQRLYPDDHPHLADTYYQIGKVHFLRRDFDRALDLYQRALISLVPGFSNPEIHTNPEVAGAYVQSELLKVLADKAETLRTRYRFNPDRLKDLEMALKTYELIATLIDSIRRDFRSDDYKLIFGERSHRVYESAVDTALDLYDAGGNEDHARTAFMFSERAKAALLYEAVVESRARQFSGIPTAFLDREKRFKERLARIGTRLEKEYEKEEGGDRTRLAELEQQYYSTRIEYHQLIDHFERNYPRYYNLKHRCTPVTPTQIQAALDDESALLEFFINEERLTTFVLTRDRFVAITQTIGPEFPRVIESYARAIKMIEDKSFLYLSKWLHRLLIHPVLPWIERKRHLIVIPHADLHYLPFETLVDRDNMGRDFSDYEYLIRDHFFSYHYSASLWAHRDSENRPTEEKSFVGFAPVFRSADPPVVGEIAGNADPRANLQAADSLNTQPLPQLIATQKEVSTIIGLFRGKGRQAEGYLFQDASEENFKSAGIREFDYIHIATHSIGDRQNPKLSGLLFSRSNEPKADLEDGILYSEETFNLDLNAELMVLSSCESGIGKLVKGEGMIALNRGFFYSGARNIIFSLWMVEDRATAQLMVALYRNLLQGRSIPKSLQRAKLSLLKNRYTAFPKYWSGFILVGQ